MPTIDEYYSGGSTLKASELDDEMTFVVEGFRSHTFDDGNKSLFLKLADSDQEFRVNYSNAQRIAEMYGKNVEDWVGKSITLFPDKITSGKYKGQDTIVVKVKRTPRNSPAKQKYDEQNPPPPLDDEVPF